VKKNFTPEAAEVMECRPGVPGVLKPAPFFDTAGASHHERSQFCAEKKVFGAKRTESGATGQNRVQ
jgi:hypothetical protein